MFTQKLPLNLQFFAGEDEGSENQNQQTQQQNTQQNTQAPAIDYEKLASIVNGKQSVTEDSVLKSFFKNQGLSQEEMTQAIAAYKTEKAKNTPDINALQTQAAEAQKVAQQASLEKDATLEALALGLDSKTIPYVLKLANLSEAMGEDGKVNTETLKNAINKVLEDVPQLKPDQQVQKGFQIGGQGNNQTSATDEQLKAAFGL